MALTQKEIDDLRFLRNSIYRNQQEWEHLFQDVEAGDWEAKNLLKKRAKSELGYDFG